MLNIAASTAVATVLPKFGFTPTTRSSSLFKTDIDSSQRIADTLKMLHDTLAPQRRVVHTGDVVYQGGERFGCLYILN